MSLIGATSTVACSLDVREFRLASGVSGASGAPNAIAGAVGVAGARGGAAGQAGTAGAAGRGGTASGTGGTAGVGVDEPAMVNGCVDLDSNGTADCQETIAKNADFKTDVSEWVAETDTLLEWNEHDAWPSDASSGSALVSSVGVIDANSNNAVLRSASQCMPASGMQLVTAYANVFVEPGQDPTGRAQIVVFFFDGEGCTGAFTNSFTTPQPLGTDGVGTWLNLKAGSVTGLSTKSILVKLGLSRSYNADSFRARFDNVLVKVQHP